MPFIVEDLTSMSLKAKLYIILINPSYPPSPIPLQE